VAPFQIWVFNLFRGRNAFARSCRRFNGLYTDASGYFGMLRYTYQVHLDSREDVARFLRPWIVAQACW
jgi:hypothetical protein